MKKATFFFVIITSLLFSGCSGPSDKEIGQTVLLVTPTVYIISLGFQYLFFRLWKLKFPQLTLSWLPNFVFYIFLIIIAGIFGNGNPFWFLTDGWGMSYVVFIIFGSSFLTVLFIVTRIWLFFNPTKTFTWASILTMSFYILPAFPMIAGSTEGTSWSESIMVFWIFPGSAFFFSYNFGFLGDFTVLVFFVLLLEVWVKTKKTNERIE